MLADNPGLFPMQCIILAIISLSKRIVACFKSRCHNIMNYFDDIEYIQRTIEYVESLNGNKVVALSIFPFDKAFSWNEVSSNLKPVDPEMIEQKMKYIEQEIGIKVYSLYQTRQLAERIIYYLSEEILS